MSETKSKSSFYLGFLYFLGIFLLGFVLGTFRTLVLLPSVGKILAVIIELPFILMAAWIFSKYLTTHYRASHDGRFLLRMGTIALGLLMIAEFLFSVFLFGNSSQSFFSEIMTIHGMIGLCGQVVFGFIPILQKYFK
ncbi:MAG: hypothetical protein MH321_08080 [Leptospiraceae bacterium]|nr:hypothetical protein [Leptospiraceae bacterium]